MTSSRFSFPAGLSPATGDDGLGKISPHTEAVHSPTEETRAGQAHLLLQTDAKLLGGQRGPRRRRLGRRERPTLGQVPQLLVVPVDTAKARFSPGRGEA